MRRVQREGLGQPWKYVALAVSTACTACASNRPRTVVIESHRRVEAVEMTADSLPEDPAKAPRATDVWLVFIDEHTERIKPGSARRRDDLVVVRPLYSGVDATVPLSELHSVVFEDVNTVKAPRPEGKKRKGDKSKSTVSPVAVVLAIIGVGVLAALGYRF